MWEGPGNEEEENVDITVILKRAGAGGLGYFYHCGAAGDI